MITFVSGKLPDAHNIKVNLMFILCWGGHASVPIFYILSFSIPLHLINVLSTVRLLISKYFANSVHSTCSHSWDILVALLSTFPTYTPAHRLQACTFSPLLCTSCLGYFPLDLQMKLWNTAFTFSTTHLHSTVQ